MYFSIGTLAILFWWYCFRVILPSGSIFFADPNMVSFCEGGRSSCFSTDTNEAYIQVSKPLDVIGGSDIDWLTRTTPLSPPDDRTREPNHWPDFLSYCWPVGARVFPTKDKIYRTTSFPPWLRHFQYVFASFILLFIIVCLKNLNVSDMIVRL